MVKRINNLEDADHAYHEVEQKLVSDPEFQFPDSPGPMTARTYKTKFAEPLVRRLKKLIQSLLVWYFKGVNNYHCINQGNRKLY